MSKSIHDEAVALKNYVLDLFVGDRLGKGSYRHVYKLKEDISKVLKVEYCGNVFSNVHEYQVWKEVQHTPIEKFFAPCYEIDAMGIALIQARTTPFESNDDFEKAVRDNGDKIPAFMDDVHFGNWGMFEGRPVCHDYGFTTFLKDAVAMAWRLYTNDGVQGELFNEQ